MKNNRCGSSRMTAREFQRAAERWLGIAAEVLCNPAAPLFEDLPQAYIRHFVLQRPELALSEDAAGNLLVKYPARGGSAEPLVMAAHLDHPAFHAESVSGRKVQLAFKGYIAAKHARAGQRLCVFRRGLGQPAGRLVLTRVKCANGRLESASARLVSGEVRAGDFTAWDFPGFAIKGGKIVSRACDDALGAAAALCALDEMSRRRPKGAALWALFTRAEEMGFLGALEAIRLKTLPKRACILSLEASKALESAPQGGGVIVRVGDKTSLFDPSLTAALEAAAGALAKRLPNFKFQRKLMDGGTCEATAFCAAGYRASGLAVPLGNYHNQSFDAKGRAGIGPEHVRVVDFLSEVHLLAELALHPKLLRADAAAPLAARLAERAAFARKMLKGNAPPVKWTEEM